MSDHGDSAWVAYANRHMYVNLMLVNGNPNPPIIKQNVFTLFKHHFGTELRLWYKAVIEIKLENLKIQSRNCSVSVIVPVFGEHHGNSNPIMQW